MATVLRRKYSKGVGTTNTAVGGYTAPGVSTGVMLTGLVLTNNTVSTITASAGITDGTFLANLVVQVPILPGGAVNLCDHGNRQVLNVNDQVIVSCSVAAGMDVNMSLEEIT
jgi:hypothetical protein